MDTSKILVGANPAGGNLVTPPPTLNGYGTDLARFAKESEQHFGGDMARLHDHVSKQPPEEQKALLNHSKSLREFLGIREQSRENPYRYVSSPASQETVVSSGAIHSLSYSQRPRDSAPGKTIHYSEAPAALATAATLLTDEALVEQALARLEKVMKENPVNQSGLQGEGKRYRTSIGNACKTLLGSLSSLKNEKHQKQVLDLIIPAYGELDPLVQADLRWAARTAISEKNITETIKADLKPLALGMPLHKLEKNEGSKTSGEPAHANPEKGANEIARPGYTPITLDKHIDRAPHYAALANTTDYARQAADRLVINGKLNRTHIQRMIEDLRNEKLLPEDYREHAIRTLKKLENSKRLGSIINSVCKKTLLKPEMAELVRTTLDMSPKDPVFPAHARKAVVMSLLGYLRQGQAGSCFATAVGICLLNSSQEVVAADMKELLETGKLTFNAEGGPIDIPINLRFDQTDVQSKFSIVNGIYADDAELLKILDGPAMHAALNALGIDKRNWTDEIATAVKTIREAGADLINFQTVIEQIARQTGGDSFGQKTLTSALNAFSMRERVGLLVAWEMTLASSAETLKRRPYGEVLSNAILHGDPIAGRPDLRSLSSIVQEHQQALQSNPDHSTTPIDDLGKAMLSGIEKRMKQFTMQYDASVPRPEGNFGAFVLHNRIPANDPSKWRRISDPVTFQAAIKGLIDDTYVSVSKKLPKLLDDPDEQERAKKALLDIAKNLAAHVGTEEFLEHAIRQVNPKVRSTSELEKIAILPWKQKKGGPIDSLIEAYGGAMVESSDFDARRGKARAEEPRDMTPAVEFLFNALSDMAPELQAKAAEGDKEFKIPCADADHTFAIMPNQMKEAWQDTGSTVEQWINDKLKAPAMQYLSEKRIDPALITLATEAASKLGINARDIYLKVAEKSKTPFRDGKQAYTLGDLYEELKASPSPYKNKDQLLAGFEAYLDEKCHPPAVSIADYGWFGRRFEGAVYLQVRYNPFRDRIQGQTKTNEGGATTIDHATHRDWSLSTPLGRAADTQQETPEAPDPD